MIKTLQGEVNRWAMKNFDAQKHHPLLGLVEEIGELADAVFSPNSCSDIKVRDAVGDTMIFLAHYCAMNGYCLDSLITKPRHKYSSMLWNCQQSLYALMTTAGKLCHAHLKQEQKIRGDENHRQKSMEAIQDIFGLLKVFCENKKWNIEKVVDEIWREVQKRDWRKNPNTGAVHGIYRDRSRQVGSISSSRRQR